MLKKLILLSLIAALFMFAAGCSDDDEDTVTNGETHDSTATTGWVAEDGGYWLTVVDASDYDIYGQYSFSELDTTATSAWDIGFRRDAVKLNGGASAEGGGTVVGIALDDTAFASVTINDTTGYEWEDDAIDYAIDSFYIYNPITHQVSMTNLVYSMLDAEGDNYIKFRVDSITDIAGQGDMGTVHISYFYQETANSTNLDGDIQTASIEVGMGTGYFDFSTGTTVTPADPANSLDWDLGFSGYNIFQNNDPHGIGDCAAFDAYSTNETDATDIEEFTLQPAGPPLFPDVFSSVLTDWYEYLGEPTHNLLSHNIVYLVKVGDSVYKVQIISYYGDVSGAPTSGIYSFRWKEL